MFGMICLMICTMSVSVRQEHSNAFGNIMPISPILSYFVIFHPFALQYPTTSPMMSHLFSATVIKQCFDPKGMTRARIRLEYEDQRWRRGRAS